jgi:NitT/TauT family transport system substrate-binding protein
MTVSVFASRWWLRSRRTIKITLVAAWVAVPCAQPVAARDSLRLGYFPNLTHAQAVLGIADGSFRKVLGPDVDVETRLFNAGPSVVEAIFAGAIDMAWIGPSPAINGHLKSRGEIVVIAGGCTGGASLIVRPGAGIVKPGDFKGKRVGTPQLGNTQDVACRTWLRSLGLNPTEPGATVHVVPVANPDQLTLFRKDSLDAVWAVEPWASRLVLAGGGTVFQEERGMWKETDGRYPTAELITTRAFLARHRALVVALLRAHVKETRWIEAHRQPALAALTRELARLAGGSLPPGVLDRAWKQVRLTWDPGRVALVRYAQWGHAEGFLGKEPPDLSRLVELGPLNEALQAEGLPVQR